MNLDDDGVIESELLVGPSTAAWRAEPHGTPNPVGLYNRVEQKVPTGSAVTGDGEFELPPCEPPPVSPVATKKTLTAGRKFWLWSRFVLGGFAVCGTVLGGVLLVDAIIDLFTAGNWVPAVVIISVLLSFGGGTLAYLSDKHDCPKNYR